jgi:hypothetical protein
VSDTSYNERPSGATGRDEAVANPGNTESFRARWSSVQASFVDDPRRPVLEAERLVNDVTTDLVEVLRRHHQHLDRDRNTSTDEMRRAFQRYCDFFDRLLNV